MLTAFACARTPTAPLGPAPNAADASLAVAQDAGEAPDAVADAASLARDGDVGEPETERDIDPERVQKLVDDARASESDALVIIKDEKLVGEWRFGKPNAPIETMSITKSVIGLAIGTLVDSGKLSPELSVATLYPEWSHDERAKITIEHLLTHSSGLEEGDTTLPIYRSHDWVRFTLETKLQHPPGTHFEYSNRAANLLSGVIAKVSGMRADRYVKKTLFDPLEIREFWWTHDKAGQASGMAGLHLLPRDLAKLGVLIVNEGKLADRALVSADWMRRSTRELATLQPPNKRLGRLFWLVPEWSERVIDDGVIDEWHKAGVSDAFVAKVSPLKDRRFATTRELLGALGGVFGDDSLTEWNETTWKRGLPDVRFTFGPTVGVYSAGTLGQYLVVLPRDRLVVVRMRRSPKNPKDRDDPRKTMPDFIERVQGLLRPPTANH